MKWSHTCSSCELRWGPRAEDCEARAELKQKFASSELETKLEWDLRKEREVMIRRGWTDESRVFGAW